MSKKLIFLVGAPTLRSLRWDEDELLDNPIYPFSASTTQDRDTWPGSSDHVVKWRLLQDLAAQERHHHNVLFGSNRGAIFLTTQDLTVLNGASTITSADSAISQFYDHSFAVHETSDISAPGMHSTGSTQESGLWAESTETSLAAPSDRKVPGLGSLSIQGGLSDLKDIPSAPYLQSIMPQTMTTNLIAGIIVIHPPRRIVTRQWKRELDLVEVVVGDETRTGFGITFWLAPADETIPSNQCDSETHELRKTLSSLRPRDIVLLRTVGLSTFRERVYGQSLRRGVTKIDLLHRQRVDATDPGGIYSTRSLQNLSGDRAKQDDLPLMKVCKVREWIRRFVDTAPDRVPDRVGGGYHTLKKHGQPLPPDTQEASGYY